MRPAGAEIPLRPLADPARLRDALAEAGYTQEGIPAALGLRSLSVVMDSDAQSALARSHGQGLLGALVRLFLLAIPEPADRLRQALGTPGFEALVACGALALDADTAVPRVRLAPCEGLLLGSDLPLVSEAGARPDYVMGPGSSSLLLVHLLLRRPVERALDLGTGAGVLALLLAREAERVVGVDASPRALRFAAFNARMNGVEHVALVQGDFLAPLQQESFDLVVSNPPYVISPQRRYLFRDGGMRGDALCGALAREAAARLREGGFAQVLYHVAHVKGERWQDRVAGWCQRTGCDALALRFDTRAPADYASEWLSATETGDPARLQREVAEWTAYLETEGIEAVSSGALTLRRSGAARPWFRAHDAPARIAGRAGEQILRAFRAQDFLASAGGDEALLAARLRIAPEARLEQVCASEGRGWRLESATLRLERGLTYSGEVEPLMAELVARCDGSHALRELLAEICDAWKTSPGAVAAAALPGVRLLIERGFLLPEAT